MQAKIDKAQVMSLIVEESKLPPESQGILIGPVLDKMSPLDKARLLNDLLHLAYKESKRLLAKIDDTNVTMVRILNIVRELATPTSASLAVLRHLTLYIGQREIMSLTKQRAKEYVAKNKKED